LDCCAGLWEIRPYAVVEGSDGPFDVKSNGHERKCSGDIKAIMKSIQ